MMFFVFAIGCNEEKKYSIDISEERKIVLDDVLLNINYSSIEYQDITFSFSKENRNGSHSYFLI